MNWDTNVVKNVCDCTNPQVLLEDFDSRSQQTRLVVSFEEIRKTWWWKLLFCLSNTLRQRDFYCYWKYTELRTVDWELRYNESAQISLTLQVKNARISTPLVINLIMELPRPPKTKHLRNASTLIYKIKQ